MKSVTSFFDFHTVRKDVTRFAPVWGIYLIGGILIMLSSVGYREPYYTAQNLTETLAGLSIINMLYAGLVALLLFGDLFNPRLCNALHAMPLRREQWFASHVLSGLCFSIIPNAIGIACLLPSLASYGYVALIWLLGMTLQYVFFFGLAVFSVFCTGNRFAMLAVYAILNAASVLAMTFITSIYEPLLFGMQINPEPFRLFCPVFQLCSFNDPEDFIIFRQLDPGQIARSDMLRNYYVFDSFGTAWGYHWILAGLGVALFAVSLLLYRRRALETAGDFMAVRPLAPVFSLIYTLTIGILFSAVGDLMIGEFSVFLMVGMIIGFFTGQMLLQRTVKVFKPKAFLKCGAILILLLVSMGLVWIDPLGISRYVPEPEKVEQVEVDIRYGADRPVVLTDAEDIRVITELHQQIVASGRPDEHGTRFTAEITYTMKNGSKILRTYTIRKDTKAFDALKAYLSRPEHLLEYTDWYSYVNQVVQIYVDSLEDLPKSQHKAFLEAIKADCEAGNLVQNEAFHEYCGKDYPEFKGWISIVTENEFGQEVYQEVRYYNDAKNILAFLKANGVTE